METPSHSRRGFLKTAAALGIGGAGWLGGTHLYLKDDRWTPNRSFWVSRGRAAVNPPLKGTETADVAIIGGGVTGLSTALHLLTRHPGLKVVLLEAQYAGFGATGRSGGVLGDGTEIGEPEGTSDNVAHVMEVIDKQGIVCDLEHQPATQRGFDEVKKDIGEKLRRQLSVELAQKDGAAKLEQLRKGADAGVKWGAPRTVSRRDAQGLPRELLQPIVAADVSKLPAYIGIPVPDAGYLLVRIGKVIEADPKEKNPESGARVGQLFGAAQYDAYVASLRSRADIEIKPENLEKK